MAARSSARELKTGLEPNPVVVRRPWNWRSMAAKLSLMCGSLLVTFLLVEAGMRLAGAKPQTATVLSTYFEFNELTGWRGKPNAASQFTTTNFDVFITHDADGYRRCGYDQPIATDAASPHRVVWVLGDSGTWGWGVNDGKTYVDLLNKMSTDGTRYRNLGHCGFSSVQEYLLLADLFNRGQKPDEVVVLFCGNDLHENLDSVDQRPPRAYLSVDRETAELKNYPTTKAGWGLSTWLKNNSLAWNHAHFYLARVKQKWKDESMRTDRKPDEKTAEAPPEPEIILLSAEEELDAPRTPPDIVGLREAYRLMNELCRKNGVQLYIVNDGPETAPRVCSELGIPCFDLAQRWSAYKTSAEADQPWCFPTDPHFNELGHRLIAEAIHEALPVARRSATTLTAQGPTGPTKSVR